MLKMMPTIIFERSKFWTYLFTRNVPTSNVPEHLSGENTNFSILSISGNNINFSTLCEFPATNTCFNFEPFII